VRAHDLDAPVILMTGDPKLETAMEAVSLGALQYFAKPVPNNVLVAAVQRASRLYRLAQAKREALKLMGQTDAQAGDLAGLQAGFDRVIQTMWMAFQPIVDLGRRTVFGYETLLRSEEASLPHPEAVLDAAERLGRLHELGRRTRELAAEVFVRAPANALLFVNLHTHDLLDPHLYDAGGPLASMAERVVLEITERATIDDVEDVQSRVGMLRRLGFRIAIDDLGAGYAGLSSFVALEPNIVKLDMSIVRNVHQSAIRRRLVESMASLCGELGIQVVAEGVELVDEQDTLRDLGCQLLQGFLFAKPGRPFPSVEGFA
jgi:EAL domain-containing protein (putative c-di-GMP-specific phosphodiesterase class I)